MRQLPYFCRGQVVRGFGRGSKQLGIPTANFPEQVVDNLPADVSTGMYYGWPSVGSGDVHKMVVSMGWNPYYRNTKKVHESRASSTSCTILLQHVLYPFVTSFLGQEPALTLLTPYQSSALPNPQRCCNVETHIIHTFKEDFYGEILNVAIVGYLRPEKNFDSLEALISAIQGDIEEAKKRLDLPEHLKVKDNNFFQGPKSKIMNGH
ncbi:PREDICTED: riboflavin kinase [Ceratotherium simum simum]|uniref:riboflavin kinase n=1 Tax=Ceratotherium simum simum TaxID=73337 RepID=A0ABM1DEE3_CERSS|nr:PREDICTED: riboflavin kinase [Ceratotherium simum simum]